MSIELNGVAARGMRPLRGPRRRFGPASPWAAAVALGATLCAGHAAAQQMAPPVVTTVKLGHWETQPTFAEVEAAKPAGVTGRGLVVFRGCRVGDDGRLKDCAVKAEPDDERLRKAAEALLPRYRFAEADAKAMATGNGRVDFYIGWLAETGCKPPFCAGAAGVPVPPPPRR